jgi:hypothetical protein
MKNTKDTKRKEAEQRNMLWSSLSPQTKLEELDRRLGVGVGAKKQRQKLAILIEEATKGKKDERK